MSVINEFGIHKEVLMVVGADNPKGKGYVALAKMPKTRTLISANEEPGQTPPQPAPTQTQLKANSKPTPKPT